MKQSQRPNPKWARKKEPEAQQPEFISNTNSEKKPETPSEQDSKAESEMWPEVEPDAQISVPETSALGSSTDYRTFIRPSSEAPDALLAVPQAILATLKKGKPSHEYPLGVMNHIGRAQENNIRIKSPTVSRKHALVTVDAKDFILKDLGSLSGTFVNEKKVSECTLADGDRIKVGDVELVFRLL